MGDDVSRRAFQTCPDGTFADVNHKQEPLSRFQAFFQCPRPARRQLSPAYLLLRPRLSRFLS